MRYRPVLFVAIAVLSLGIFGCGSGNQDKRTSIRLVHAIADLGPIDIWLQGNKTKLYENVSYQTVTNTLTLAPGTYNFQVRPAFASSSTAPVAQSGPIEIDEGGGSATIVAAGLIDVPEADPNEARVLALMHNFTTVSQVQAVARFVHAAPGAPDLDLRVENDERVLVEHDDQEVLGLARYTSSDPAGIPVDANDPEQLLVFAATTTDLLSSFTTPLLADQGQYFVIFIGSIEASPRDTDAFEIMVVDQLSNVRIVKQNPRLYVMNTVADAPLISSQYRRLDPEGVPIGIPEPLLADLPFGELGNAESKSILLPPGRYEFTFTIPEDNPFPTVQPLLGAGDTGELLAGEQYLVCASGRADQTFPFELITAEEKFDLNVVNPETKSFWRIVHSAPDLTSVVLGEIINNEFFQLPEFPTAISPGQTTEPTGTDIGILSFFLAIVRQADTEEFGIWDVEPEPEARDFVVLLGSKDATPEPPESIEHVRLIFVDTTMQPWSTETQDPLPVPIPD
ncbi:MAG: DUF4397 domain-containing protein [Planctomycetota bacterium]|jgi:hypothetical protein